MFNLQEFVNDMTVTEDDTEYKQSLEIVELIQLICEDAWLARQAMYGMAGAMERQLTYIGGTLLPNTEQRITRYSGEGVSGESYVMDNWAGVTNADKPHINDENPTEALDNAQNFAEQLRTRMRTAAILFVTHVRAHDDLSSTLEQLSYAGIKAKANANRNASTKQVATG